MTESRDKEARGLAHVLVKRIPSAIEAEDQGAVCGTIWDPDAWMLVRRGASEARIQGGIEGTATDRDGGWTEERDGGHV